MSEPIRAVRRRDYRRAVLGGVVMVAMLAVAEPLEAGSARFDSGMTTRTDSVPRITRRLFEQRAFISTGYLARLIEGSRVVSDPIFTINPPEEVGRSAAYARRYGISFDLASAIVESALAEGLDPDLAFRLVRVESVFRPSAKSPGGALGLTQLMPSTARAIDRSLRTEAQILDPETNLRTGFRYLRRMIDRYDGDVRLGLLAYNRGSTAVDRSLRAGRDPENGYARKVLGVSGPYMGRGLVGSLP